MYRTMEQYEEEARKRPKDYMGVIDDWIDEGFSTAMFMHHRDSDELGESNYFTARKLLTTCDEDTGIEVEDVRETSSNHWAVGWVESLHIRIRDADGDYTEAFKEAVRLIERMEDYPVLDEEDWSRREFEAMYDYCEQEVGKEFAEQLQSYLYDEHNTSSPNEIRYEWIDEWKRENRHNQED